MKHFIDDYIKDVDQKIIDIGSLNVNGTYKPLFTNPKWKYVGLDICNGPNVDITAKDPQKWPVDDDSFDVVISGQCLEHVTAPWIWIKEIERICKPNGLLAIIAPWQWNIHRHPVDCWRILPDGMNYLLSVWCSFDVLKSGASGNDCYGFAKKRSMNSEKQVLSCDRA
jgi:SAM-dependent methyltransferase